MAKSDCGNWTLVKIGPDVREVLEKIGLLDDAAQTQDSGADPRRKKEEVRKDDAAHKKAKKTSRGNPSD
ncbi:MAG: hypothetical protein IJ523_10955 [Succinivibrionaceae bacterium]|nr:hypothetical protein [Succinivibrionaceae bacterium]